MKKNTQPNPEPEGIHPGLKSMALEAAIAQTAARNEKLAAALGWALAHAHPMSTPEWRAEAMIRAGWIPNGVPPVSFNN